jgi:hypothetical protein
VTLYSGNLGFWSGPSTLAPQSTPQSNHEIKYDGSKAVHNHILRYGASFNHIQGGGFANFYGLAPRISWTTSDSSSAFANEFGTLPGGSTNPLNYPAQNLRVGNGLGFNTTDAALGFPAGGLGPDNRVGLYIGDSWKIKPNFTFNIGLRYNRDTGRTDSDLAAIPEVNAVFPGWGNAVKQPNTNFAPQASFAWDPKGNGKTVIRGGGGLFYENIIYNNVLFDRPYRLRNGAFNQVSYACLSGVPQPVPTNAGFVTPGTGICNDAARVSPDNPKGYIPISEAIPNMVSFWNSYLAANPLDLKAANPNFIGGYLDAGLGVPLGFLAPNYKTPVSVQMNIGIQRELRRGMVVSADYLRNIETHSLLGVDINHVGDISNFNLGAAQAAITATNAGFGCGPGTGGINCAIAGGATMADYAGNGLTADTDFGQACSQALGVPCAFGGKNSASTSPQSAAIFLQPIGRSVYNAFQAKLVDNVQNPFRGVRSVNFQVAYSLSRLENSGGAQATATSADNDQDFVLQAGDFNKPNRYFGPSLLDRTHQISFGGYFDVPWRFRLGMIGHFYSPLSSSIVAANTAIGPGEIFRTDFTGDGSVGDPLPGTKLGSFDRDVSASGLANLISNYNNKYGNQPTPAGQVLINNHLFSASQLAALGGVAPTLAAPVPGQVNFTWLKSFDLNIGWNYRIKDRVNIEPSVAVFNLFNFGNFNLPPTTMSGLLASGSPVAGTITGTDRAANEIFRVGNGTGVYAVGAARQVEWGLKVQF